RSSRTIVASTDPQLSSTGSLRPPRTDPMGCTSMPTSGSSAIGSLAQLAQGGGEGGPQAAGRGGSQVSDKPRPRATHLLDGELDPQVSTFVAVVEEGDGPRHRGPLGVALGVVVGAVVGQLLHGPR